MHRLQGRVTDAVQGVDEAATGQSTGHARPDVSPGRLQESGQVGASEVGHAHDPEAGLRIVQGRIDRHNVGVLEPGQHPGFPPQGLADLDGHVASVETELLGKEDAREGASA